MSKRRFKVVNENQLYFEREGVLVYENQHELMLRVDCGEYSEDVIFDKSEVEEIGQ